MKHAILTKHLFLAMASASSVIVGAFALQSCAGEGGSVGGGGGGGGGDSSIAQQFIELMPAAQRTASFAGSDRCGDCHGGRDHEEEIHANWEQTLHATRGVGCESCHGPGSIHQADPSTENILTFPKVTSAVVCAQCHGPIYDEWRLSQHSQIVVDPVEEAAQQPARYGRSSRCVACHSGLFRTEVYEHQEDPVDLTDDEIREIAEQTLEDVPHTATCATCHNPHAQTGNLTDDGEEVQLRHPVLNTDTTDVAPGTTAPTFTKFNHICAQCHNGRGTNPDDAALQAATSRPSMHDSNQYNMLMGIGGVEGSGEVVGNTSHMTVPGQCSHCHMPDSRHTFTVSYDKGCAPCHTAADAAARVATVKDQVVNELYALRTRLEGWASSELGDLDFWDYTSVITAEGKTPPDQALVPIEVKRARHNYYFVLRDRCFGPHNAPYALHLLNVANENLDALSAPAVLETGRSYESKLQSLLEHLEAARKAERLFGE